MLDDFDDIRLRDLVLFDRIVQLGTITAAARDLGLPKPTAGRWLALLEARAGRPLVIRGSRQIRLTDHGRAFHHQVQSLLVGMRALRAMAGSEEQGGVLRVSIPVPFGRLLGGPVIRKFRQQMPGVRLEALLQNHRVDLVNDGFDLALRGGVLPDSDLLARRLANVPMWLYVSHGQHTTPLDRVGIIAAPGDEALLAKTHPSCRPASVVVDDRTAVSEALMAGAGAGILPAFLGEPGVQSGELVRLGDAPLSTASVHAVWLPEQRSDVRIRTLVDLIASELKAWQ